jgi:hypothetical protein
MLSAGGPAIKFSKNAVSLWSPWIGSSAGDNDFWWDGPAGRFFGKEPLASLLPAGSYTLRSSKWNTVTDFWFYWHPFTSLDMSSVLRKMTSLERLYLAWNHELSVSTVEITPLPASLLEFWAWSGTVDSGLIYGDIKEFGPLPPSLTTFNVSNNPLIVGDLATITPLPSSLLYLYLWNTGIVGNIGGLGPLPAGLRGLFADRIDGLYGDIADISPLPTGLDWLALEGAITGDIANFSPLPVAMQQLTLGDPNNKCTIYGDIGSLGPLPSTMTFFYTYMHKMHGDIEDLGPLPVGLEWLYACRSDVGGDFSEIGTLPAPLLHIGLHNCHIQYGTGKSMQSVANNCVIRVWNNNWPQSMVDRFLADCVASGATGLNINISGTNESPTDGQNNADRLTLLSRGGTVTVS